MLDKVRPAVGDDAPEDEKGDLRLPRVLQIVVEKTADESQIDHEAALQKRRAEHGAAPMTLDAFRALCEADALLVAADAIDLITAVDRLEQKACACGLIGAVGQDEVQQVMAAVFGSRR